MKRRKVESLLIIALLFGLLTGCTILSDFTLPPQGPTPVPVPSPTPLVSAEITFNLALSQETQSDVDIALVLLDEVTGLAYNTLTVPMNRTEAGHWQASLTPPASTLLRYRYVRLGSEEPHEVSATGDVIRYRVAHIPGPIQIQDTLATWSGMLYEGPTGRIIGRVQTLNGDGIPEIIVAAAGLTTFTDGDGSFRLNGLPPGLHNLTAFSPTGAFQVSQQGALIAGDSTTPAEITMTPAKKVQVAFQVTVPSDTIPGMPIRLAGNVLPLGNRFAELQGGLSASAVQLPSLVMIDSTHYLTVQTLYAGTDLRYKYTLGDGLWNAERDSNGFFFTRQIIVPDEDLVVNDIVSSWRGENQGSYRFQVKVPEHTPATDQISVQFNPFIWFEPLPMSRLGEDEWFFVLHGPLNFSETLQYRYCRNLQCGSADDAQTSGPNAPGRQLDFIPSGNDLIDEVVEWQWFNSDQPTSIIVAPDVTPREGFEVGLDFLPSLRPDWVLTSVRAIEEASSLGINALTLSPAWVLRDQNPVPIISFDPSRGSFKTELGALVSKAADQGIRVNLRPSLQSEAGRLGEWWINAARDTAWWKTWFEEYRSFMLTYASFAGEIGATRLILNGVEVAPALPSGLLPDGSPSRIPINAEEHWRDLIDEIRERFSGKLAFEIRLQESLQPIPPFLDAVDEVFVYWQVPLVEDGDADLSTMQTQAREALEGMLGVPSLVNLPIFLSVEYLSVDGGLASCPRAPDGSCRELEAFDHGSVVDPDLQVDQTGQSEAINAVLLEANARSDLSGFYVRGYNPLVALQDKSASVNGKLARDVLWWWYPRITGLILDQ